MKKTLSIIGLLLAAGLLTVSAQTYIGVQPLPTLTKTNADGSITITIPAPVATNAPAPPATNLLQSIGLTSLGAGWSAFSQGFVDDLPYISNRVVSVTAGALYNPSDKHGKVGGFIGVSVPMTSQTDLGLGGFYLNKQIGNAEASINLGMTVSNFMGLGKLIGPVFTSTGAGPDYNFSKDPATGKAFGTGSFIFSKTEKNFHVSKTWNLSFGAGPFNISTIPGVGWFGDVKLTKNF